ncbi:MAG: tRNA (adenosine(37)-N6)-threonylcarbamoyltransferase complex ATPase subunit type 1 TsaE [Lentisphaerae bacterium]|jgi:tRNA threonylcarbamoyladenosine biosynthesis protein TsaE|nr:tRNA (adenosine(37)-N6)-threonylcarbamoyltransferase complex ATPase subunit type 1 TsaE [Lentisphaerota bacterium]
MQINSHSEEETLSLGKALAKLLRPGMVVALYGDLGAGKTALSRGVARGLGITEPVTSPTFTVVQEYRTPGGIWFYHLDMYRITDEQAALAFGIEEYLFADNAIAMVEWPERIAGLLRPGAVLNITMTHAGENQRQLELPDDIGARLTSTQR